MEYFVFNVVLLLYDLAFTDYWISKIFEFSKIESIMNLVFKISSFILVLISSRCRNKMP